MTNLPDLLALLVIVGTVPVLWIVFLRLWRRLHLEPHLRLLRAGTVSAFVWAVVVTMFALVFLNNGMEAPILDPFTTMVLTRSALLAPIPPALYWLWLYR